VLLEREFQGTQEKLMAYRANEVNPDRLCLGHARSAICFSRQDRQYANRRMAGGAETSQTLNVAVFSLKDSAPSALWPQGGSLVSTIEESGR